MSRRNREEVTKRSRTHEKLAKFAANLYKAIKALTTLSPLYVFSAEAFTNLYLDAESMRKDFINTDNNEQDQLAEKKLISLTLHHCTQAAYRKHRLTLALHLILCLNPVPESERNLLLDGGNLKGDENTDFTVPDYVPEERKIAVKALATCLPQVAVKLQKDWFDDLKNINREQNLTPFQKVLVIQALRPDHLHTALTKLATEQLGNEKKK